MCLPHIRLYEKIWKDEFQIGNSGYLWDCVCGGGQGIGSGMKRTLDLNEISYFSRSL